MKMNRKFATAVSLVVAFAGAFPAFSAGFGPTDIVTINGPFGPARLSAWSWWASSPFTVGGAIGKIKPQDFSFTMRSELISQGYVIALFTGLVLSPVEVVDGAQKFAFTNVRVSSMSMEDASDKSAGTVTFTFNFEKVKYTIGSESLCYDAVQSIGVRC